MLRTSVGTSIIMKARITITAFDKDKHEAKGKKKTEETEPDSNLPRDSSLTRTTIKL